jgi:hypothetical protein
MNDAELLAGALDRLLHAVWDYDKETPVQTRLQTQHDAMRENMARAKDALFQYQEKMQAIAYVKAHTHKRKRRPCMLDGEAAPEYRIQVEIDSTLKADEWRVVPAPGSAHQRDYDTATDYPQEEVTL